MGLTNIYSDIIMTNEALNVPMTWCRSIIQHQAPVAVSVGISSEQRHSDADDVWLRDGKGKSRQGH